MTLLQRAGKDDRGDWLRMNRDFMAFEIQNDDLWNNVNGLSNEEYNDEFGKAFDEGLQHPELLTIFMVMQNGKSMGFVNLMTIYSVWAKGRALIIDDLYIEPEHRGRGIGRSVMNELLSYAKANGYKRIQFQSEKSNPEAKAFYKSIGFIPTEMDFYLRYL